MVRRGAAAALLALAALSACVSGPYDFSTEDGTLGPCRTLVKAVPDDVGGQKSTPVDSERVAAWGDPRIVLRCGVTRPSALEPTSRCDDVNGVGWFTEETDGRHVFTTIGRTPAVSVDVPADVEPAGAALLDLADTIKQHTTVTDPCQ